MSRFSCFVAAALMLAAIASNAFGEQTRPNVLFVSVDDMSCDSVGVYGCPVPGTTPNIDRLASDSLRFHYAHVQVGNCMPSRNVMFSGRYPHNNRVEGFYQVRNPGYPHLADLFNDAGYLTAIRGKVSHSTPYTPYPWGLVLDTLPDGQRAHPKDVQSYYTSTKMGIDAAKQAGKPFCMLVNISDPHKPFYGIGKGNKPSKDPHKPSRIFSEDEITVPGFLPDVPAIRKEVALYYTTVRRADDCVGQVMKALEQSGQAENTFLVFLSDHGMPLPFAKTAVYHHSTRTPWIVRWPGVTKRGSVDRQHMISSIDLLPTLLDVAGIKHPEGLEGKSFETILRGEKQQNREFIVKVYNENSGAGRHPMRSIETKRFGYIFNPWSNGERTFKTATTGTVSYRTMKTLASSDKKVAERLDLFDHRVVEEFYDYESDPDALHNLIDDPAYAEEIEQHRKRLTDWMRKSGDHALEAMLHRDQPEVLEAYVAKVQAEATARRQKRKNRNAANGGAADKARAMLIAARRKARRDKYIELLPAKRTSSGYTLRVRHRLPAELGKQKLHVSLRDGKEAKRYQRVVMNISGEGVAEIAFDSLSDQVASVRWAAFVGKDYENHLMHLVTEPTPPPK